MLEEDRLLLPVVEVGPEEFAVGVTVEVPGNNSLPPKTEETSLTKPLYRLEN